jgi:hypothetical protein
VAEVEASRLPRPDGLLEVASVLDIGAGLRPMGWYTPKRHVCVEPHQPYADKLRAAGYETWRMLGHHALRLSGDEFEAIYLLDVIEHMSRMDGEICLKLAKKRRPKQIVVATPVGFAPQDKDAWDMGGEFWQTHRSGWLPSDFPGWTISFYPNGTNQGGFTAVSP